MQQPEPLADHLKKIYSQGFRAFKIGWGPFGWRDRASDEKMIRTASGVLGSEPLLMVDAGGSNAFWPNDLKWAYQTAQMLSDYGIYWFEEPLCPDNLAEYVLLRKQAPLPIAGGEVLTRRQAFFPWIQKAALDIFQPDVTKVGGISEERRIAWMVEDAGLRFIPHGWNTALGLAADLHLASACRRTNLVEYLTGSPFIDELVEEPWHLDSEGFLSVPSNSGLGINLNMDNVERFTGEKFNQSRSGCFSGRESA